MKNMKPKTVLVTGAARGLGLELVRHHLQRGDHVAAWVRSSGPALEALRSASPQLLVMQADISRTVQVRQAADTLKQHWQQLDILYNNAAIQQGWHDNLEEHTQEEWARIFQVNVFALVRLTVKLVHHMRERKWGRIVNLTSGIDKTPQLAAYGASKWAVDKWTDDLASELKGSGVIVSRLDPGWLSTDLGGPNADNKPETVLPGALVPALLADDAEGGQFFRAQEHREYQL